ncbi:hypothetical protein [Rheinheimera metallidurans]|uniref:hypothetical protein n=1 Tax=Rheinheimera metallidurans TaxID=2925781 RepID=UPI0030013465
MKIYIIAIILTTVSILLGAIGSLVQAPVVFLIYFVFIYFNNKPFIKNFFIGVMPFFIIVFFAMYLQNHYAGLVILFSSVLGATAGYLCAKLSQYKAILFVVTSVGGALLITISNNTWVSNYSMAGGVSERNISLGDVIHINDPEEYTPKFSNGYSIVQLWTIDCGSCRTSFPFWEQVKTCAEKSDDIDFRSLHLPSNHLGEKYFAEAESILKNYRLNSASNIYLNKDDSVNLKVLGLHGVSSYLIMKKDDIIFSQHTINIKGSLISSKKTIADFFRNIDLTFSICLNGH